jgi:hypothetical protein
MFVFSSASIASFLFQKCEICQLKLKNLNLSYNIGACHASDFEES